jgi:hypothetical protein
MEVDVGYSRLHRWIVFTLRPILIGEETRSKDGLSELGGEETRKLTKSGVLCKSKLSSLARLNHSYVRNAQVKLER